LDELIEPARRGGRRARARIEIRFHLCGSEQIVEAGAGVLGGLLDRAGDPRAQAVNTCRGVGACCVDRHCLWCPAPRTRSDGLPAPFLPNAAAAPVTLARLRLTGS